MKEHLKDTDWLKANHFSKVYLQSIITYMFSASTTQEVNHALSSVGGKLHHYFITHHDRLHISKNISWKPKDVTDCCGTCSWILKRQTCSH